MTPLRFLWVEQDLSPGCRRRQWLPEVALLGTTTFCLFPHLAGPPCGRFVPKKELPAVRACLWSAASKQVGTRLDPSQLTASLTVFFGWSYNPDRTVHLVQSWRWLLFSCLQLFPLFWAGVFYPWRSCSKIITHNMSWAWCRMTWGMSQGMPNLSHREQRGAQQGSSGNLCCWAQAPSWPQQLASESISQLCPGMLQWLLSGLLCWGQQREQVTVYIWP